MGNIVSKFLHTRMRVSNLEETVKFYKTVFGLEVSRRHESPRGSKLVFLAVPNSDEEIESGVGAILGSLIGSKVGAEIGSAITKLNGVELLILLDSGKYVSIIQEAGDKNFMSGQAVKIIRSGGKSRVLPRN